jgi:UDPglucose 6-dehydrogenase
MKIAIFGTGYVGLVTGACLANLGHHVTCVDIDQAKIDIFEQGKIPFFEPGLKDLVLKNKEKGRLVFTTNGEEAIKSSNVIFNCVGTPSTNNGGANLEYVFNVAKTVALHANGPKILVNKSTVPPGTARKCADIIAETNPNATVDVVSNPEFLAEGKAVHDFTHPDKIVVGTTNHDTYSTLRKVYTGRVRTYIPVLETDWETAEMIKYANNSFLATKISFVNEMANICDKVGADIKIIAQAMGMDYRINPKFLNAGLGYGGSCFPKDVRALVNTAQEYGYSASLLREVNALNERQKLHFVEKVKSRFGDDLTGKVFSVWGLSFKPKTDDIREASSLVIIQGLLDRGATVKTYDPIATQQVKELFQGNVTFCGSLPETVAGSSAIILATEWDEFRNVNFGELAKDMAERVLFDGRNIYEPEMVKEEGFEYIGVGRK